MRTLIIGGAGFLGSALLPVLSAQGHDVAVCDNFSNSIQYRFPKNVRLFSADAAQYNTLKHVFDSFNPEIIIIALAHGFPADRTYKFYEDTKLVLDSAITINTFLSSTVKHVYFCSSGEVYGGPETRKPLKESRKIHFSANHHGSAKLAAEQVLFFRCQELGIPLTIMRIFDLFGPRTVFNPRTGVVSFLVDAFLRNDIVGLKRFKRLRDFIHVDDVVRAVVGLIGTTFSGTVNIGFGKGTNLQHICKGLGELIDGRQEYMEIPDGLLPTFSRVADISVLSAVLPKWKPRKPVMSELPNLIKFREEENAASTDAASILRAMRGLS